MTPRDWTLTDQADEADDRRDREWWRGDPYANPDYRANSPEDDEDEARWNTKAVLTQEPR